MKASLERGKKSLQPSSLTRTSSARARKLSVSQDEKELSGALMQLKSIYGESTLIKPKDKKKPGTKKRRKKKEMRIDEKTGKEEEVELEEFVYDWKTCCCGMSHPPIPDFDPPRPKRCNYYWQIAEMFPYMTLYRILSTEIQFKKADTDESGLIEMPELKKLLKDAFGYIVTDKMVEKVFNEIDTDGSGSLDFGEVLAIVDDLVQRRHTKLPEKISRDYSKVCSIQ